jgi:uncharacterized protein (DUF983 family)
MFGVAGARRLPRTNSPRQEPPTIGRAALHGLCPRCGAQTVFEELVRFQPRCTACRLDFSAYEAGGRFAAVITFFVVILLIVASIAVDSALNPPFWLQILLWVPLTMAAVIFAMRYAKSGWLALRYAKSQMPQDPRSD